MFSQNAKSLPVIMYHNINASGGPLAISPEIFETHCAVMADKGWKGVSLEEAEAFFLHGDSLPQKSVLITFDDGYLDNYVNAWPILEKYGHKGVVFATTSYVTQAQEQADSHGLSSRLTLKDVWENSVERAKLPQVDSPVIDTPHGKIVNNSFFTWDEARLMEKSGVMAIAAHSLFHDGIFISPLFEGFECPGDFLISLNKEVQGGFWGRPLFPRGAFLGERAFLPSPSLLQKLREAVPQEAPHTQNFFADNGNIDLLESIIKTHGEGIGRMETDREWRERVFTAMLTNQEILTAELGHRVKSFCWPWGISSPLALEAAQGAGFSVFYTTEKGANPPQKPLAVKRMNSRSNPHKQVKRLATYARPFWGDVYEVIRAGTKRLRATIRKA